MIKSFTSKSLKGLFEAGTSKGLNQNYVEKIKRILARLNATKELRDMNYPGSNLHILKANPYRGYYSVNVNGNYRVVFRFDNGDVFDVDYLDTH